VGILERGRTVRTRVEGSRKEEAPASHRQRTGRNPEPRSSRTP
jgi:hypothetical protein